LILVYDSIMVPELERETLNIKDYHVFLFNWMSESVQCFFSLTIKESLSKASSQEEKNNYRWSVVSLKNSNTEEFMNKKELIESIASAADISKASAEKALNGTLAAIAETLKKGDKVTLVGFGTFSVSNREARQGRNPQTGAAIKIPAKKVAKFKAGSKLSETIN